MTEVEIVEKEYDIEILKYKVQIKELELQIERLNLNKKLYKEALEGKSVEDV